MSERYSFSIRQDGMVVAKGSCPTMRDAMIEGAHYASMYESEGPLRLTVEPARRAKPKGPKS